MAKMKIIIGKGSGKKFTFDANDSSSVIEVNFNPTEYTISKKTSFKITDNPGLESSIIQFNYGEAATTSIELLFDTYASGSNDNVNDKYITKLEKLAKIDSDLHAPPPCQLLWGKLNFIGVVDNFTKKYILFLEDGTPVRAKVTLSLKEYVPLDLQAKSSPLQSPDRRKIFHVKEGDSLWQFSNKAYGDPGLWRIIAEANKIDDPKDLEVGKLLIIPVLKEKDAKHVR